MYAGTTLTVASGRVIGTHQKIDRIARRHLTRLLPRNSTFPGIRKILHYEGKNGPDGIKRKSPARDEPWHYYSPFNDQDSKLVGLITDHYKQLVNELRVGNSERIAFEAAWLAHALVDGLTPAHHYPYEERLVELRGGEGIETRTTLKNKLLLPGNTPRERLRNNWKMWGPKGLFTTHGLFEMGIATLIAPLNFSDAAPKPEAVANATDLGIVKLFQQTAREIGVLDMYDRYYSNGWTTRLTLDVRQRLIPLIIQTVTLAWYCALIDAELIKLES